MFIDVRECGNARCALKTRSPLALEQASPATKPRPAANYFSDETPALARDAVAISLASAYDWRGRSRRERSDREAEISRDRPALPIRAAVAANEVTVRRRRSRSVAAGGEAAVAANEVTVRRFTRGDDANAPFLAAVAANEVTVRRDLAQEHREPFTAAVAANEVTVRRSRVTGIWLRLICRSRRERSDREAADQRQRQQGRQTCRSRRERSDREAASSPPASVCRPAPQSPRTK